MYIFKASHKPYCVMLIQRPNVFVSIEIDARFVRVYI